MGWIRPAGAQCCNASCPAPNDPSLVGVQVARYADTAGFDIIAQAGFKWVRVQIVYVHNVPNWANGGQAQTAPLNAAHANACGAFMTDLINHPALNGRRVGEVAAAFELWNEPNLSNFWTGSAATFKARILGPGINAITARQQHGYWSAYIVAPSVYSSTGRDEPVDIGTWVSGYVADLDYVSLHAYGSESAQLAELASTSTTSRTTPAS
ncbi:MAG TPA: hypothetical protein VFD84_14455 [Candidatus Binatia bacterium]|nr:hypothetical protein [Candidatus Binatia bacterium]